MTSKLMTKKSDFFKRCLLITVSVLLCAVGSALAAAPQITAIANDSASQGATYTKTPVLSVGSSVTWTKEFGPDDMSVDSSTGTVTWAIPTTLPREAFHVGVRATNAEGSTYITWILKVGGGNFVYVGPTETYTTISAGTAAMSSGDTLVIRDGAYTGAANMMQNDGASRGTLPPSGSATVYSTVMAEHPGGVTIDGQSVSGRFPFGAKGTYASRDFNAGAGDALGTFNVAYIATKGLVFKDGDNGAYFTNHVHHMKVIDCGAYTTVTAYNAPITIFRSGYSLVEGCYVWGSGRMRIMFYICDYSIMRRNVGRLDHVSPGDPIGGWDLYSCQHCRTQNNIMVDSDQFSHYINYTNDAGIWVDQSGSSNGETWSVHIDNIHRNSIALNNDMGLSLLQNRTDGDPFNLQNSVAWDIRAIPNGYGDSISFMPFALYAPSTINQSTFGKLSTPHLTMTISWNDVSGAYLRDYTGSTHTNTNNIFYDLKAYDGTAAAVFENINSADHNNTWLTGAANGKDSVVTNTINADPTATTGAAANSLKYLTRIEPGGALLTAGASGARVGANVLTMAGKSGTLWGETGYDTDNGYPMWPFPHEGLIKTKMAAYIGTDSIGTVSGARGFCAGTSKDGSSQTLTKYIWEYLGNTIPAEVYGAAKVVDTTVPTVAISSPAANASVSGSTSVSVSATDNVGVTKVELYVNGSLFGTDTATPFTFTWDTTNLTSGNYTLSAKAYDTAGNTATSSVISVSIIKDTTSPSVAITAPASNASVSGTVALTASASDNVGVSRVEFYQNGSLLAATNVAPYSYSWNTSSIANGSYTLTAKAYDASGNIGQSGNVAVNVNNDITAPTVTAFILPVTSSSLTVPVSSLTASDNLGVTGYCVTTTNSSAGCSWSATAPASITFSGSGTQTAWAWAKDAAGNVSAGASASTTVTVTDFTIGETSVLSSDDSGNGNLMIAQATTLTQAGVVQSMSFYVSTASGKLRLGVYDATGSNGGPGKLLASTVEMTPVTGWNSASVATPTTLPAGNYWLAYLPSSSSLHFRLTSSVGTAKYYSYTYGAMPATFSASPTSATGHWSLYAKLVLADTTAPTVSITSPTNSATVSGNVAVTANATDNLGVSKVEFYVNNVLQATSTSAPFAFNWNTAAVANGSYTLIAKAYDAAGNVGQSSSVAVTVFNDTTAPSVAIASPAAGSTVGGATTVSMNASDNVAVTKVEFYVNGALQATDTASPYSFSWNTVALANGSYTLSAKAYDAAGNVGQTSNVAVTVSNDTTAPIVAIASPAAGSTVGGTATVSMNASDNVAVTKVEFYVNGVLQSTSSAAPYTFSWNTLPLASGSYTLSAKAYDAAGNVGQAANVMVTVFNDNTAPTVAVASPAAGATVSGTATVSVNASDNVAVTKVEFYVNGALQSTSSAAPYTFSWNTAALANGSYTLSAKAYDAAGNVGQSSSVMVSVNNVAATAIAFVQVASATPQYATQSVAASFSKAQTAGNLNIVVIGWNDTTSSISSVRDSVGNTYLLAATPISGNGFQQAIYYAKGIKAGSNKVTVKFNHAAAYPDVRIVEYAGVSTLDKSAAATGNGSTSTSGSVTTTCANELIFSANTVATMTNAAGTGFTSRAITFPDGNIAEDRIVSAAGTYSASAPLSTAGGWVMQVVTFK